VAVAHPGIEDQHARRPDAVASSIGDTGCHAVGAPDARRGAKDARTYPSEAARAPTFSPFAARPLIRVIMATRIGEEDEVTLRRPWAPGSCAAI
jgi:hypothetical protein